MAGETEAADDGALYVAVGIPQGIFLDPSGEVAGAVRIGGELVSLAPPEYALWFLLLAPMTHEAAVEAASNNDLGEPEDLIDRLKTLGLLLAIAPGEPMDSHLARLRPIPLGVGLGNLRDDPTTFAIQDASLSSPSPLAVNAVAIAYWWEFDGTKSLDEIVSHVASEIPHLPSDVARTTASWLVGSLMAKRLLYLDAPRKVREASSR